MAVLSEHQTYIELDVEPPVRLAVNEQRLTMDEEWTPYIQASLTCALGDGDVAGIDPLADDIWADLHVKQLLGRVDRISDITRRYRRKTLGDITAEFAGGTLADISLSVYHDYTDPGHPMRSQARDFRLMVRELVVDSRAAQVDIELASAEARLFDDAWAGHTEIVVPGATHGECYAYVLARSGITSHTNPTDGITSVSLGDSRKWQPAQTAWDVLLEMVRASPNPLIWCDEHGDFYMDNDRSTGAARTLRSAGPDRSVVNAVERRSRDDGWYTAVMCVWTDELGVITRGIATTPGQPIRFRTYEYRAGIGPPSNPDSFAERIRQRLVTRSRSVELLAVSDYNLTPGDTAQYISPRGTLTGRCTAVEWNWPADEMSVRMREVEAV